MTQKSHYFWGRSATRLSSLFGCALLAFGATAAQADLSEGLIAYYPFDGDLQDKSVSDPPAHGVGKVGEDDASITFAAGKFGEGIDLDDGAYVITPLELEDRFDFGRPDDPSGFSISAWFRVDEFSVNWQALIAKGEGNRWRMHRRGGESTITGNGGNGDTPTGMKEIDDEAIHHVVLISDPVNDRAAVYVDGELEAENSGLNGEGNDMPMMIGENPDARGRTWQGLIDDVGIWDRALSEAEITEIWNGGEGKPLAGGLDLDFNDKAQFDELEVSSNDAATTEWRASGGVDDSGYISLTDAENGARAAIIFPSIERPISGFNFSVDARIGGGTDQPADGFSVNIVRPDDPLLSDEGGGRGEGYASSPTGEGNLPEEGSQTGLGIGFDAWFSGGSDTIGFSVRVDNEILAEIPAETPNGEADDITSLQTGPQNLEGDDPYENLTWQKFTASLDPTSNVLTVTWKGEEVFKEKITYFPSPGTVVFGARTGGANQAHHFDNLKLDTLTAVRPTIVSKRIERSGLTLKYQNFPDSSIVQDSLKFTVDGEDVTASATITASEEDGDSFLTLSYAPAEPWAFSSAHSWKVEAIDTPSGNEIIDEVEADVIRPPAMGGTPLPGPNGGDGVAGGRWIWGAGTIGSLAQTVDAIHAAAEAGFEGQVLDIEHEVVNHGAGGGLFTEDTPYPEDAEGDENWTGDDFVQFIRGTIRIPVTGDYTFGVHSDDGFGLRIWGAEFTSESGAGNIDGLAANSLIHPANTGDSNSRGTVANMQAGDYDVEFFWWERGGGDFGELYYAAGAWENDEDTDQWELLGQGDVQWVGAPLPVPEIVSVSAAANVAIGFTTPDPEANHVLQNSADLVQWTDVADAALSNDGDLYTFASDKPADANSYFRIGLLPPPPLFTDGFESGAEGWEINEPWAVGATTTGPGASFDGDNVIATNLEGAFGDSVVSSLRSPLVDITGVTRPKLSFQYYIDSTEGSEGVQLKYLDADGNELFVEEDIFWGQSDGWTQFRKTIPSAAQEQPIRIEFLLLTDDSGPNGDGFYIDDFTIDD